MVRLRLPLVGLLALGASLWLACTAKQQNGQECLKDFDCEFGKCVHYVCYDPRESKLAPDAATEAATDATGDATDGATDATDATDAAEASEAADG